MARRRLSHQELEEYWKGRWEREHLEFRRMPRTLIVAVGGAICWLFLPFEIARTSYGPLSVEQWIIILAMPGGLIMMVRDMLHVPSVAEIKAVLIIAAIPALVGVALRIITMLPTFY